MITRPHRFICSFPSQIITDGCFGLNERDLRLVKKLSQRIKTNDVPSTFILTARYTNLVRVNLVLLKAYLDERRNRGLMITIDRPHQYISHLLQLHGIDQSGLVFIDAISGHSADTKAGMPSASFESGPFYIEKLPEFMVACNCSEIGGSVELREAEFILMDNIATLLTYNSMESVREFFDRYVSALKENANRPVTTLIVMDRNLHAELFAFLSGRADGVIEVTPDMELREMVSGSGRPPAPSADAIETGGHVGGESDSGE